MPCVLLLQFAKSSSVEGLESDLSARKISPASHTIRSFLGLASTHKEVQVCAVPHSFVASCSPRPHACRAGVMLPAVADGVTRPNRLAPGVPPLPVVLATGVNSPLLAEEELALGEVVLPMPLRVVPVGGVPLPPLRVPPWPMPGVGVLVPLRPPWAVLVVGVPEAIWVA